MQTIICMYSFVLDWKSQISKSICQREIQGAARGTSDEYQVSKYWLHRQENNSLKCGGFSKKVQSSSSSIYL